MDSATSTLWTGPFPKEGVSGCFLLLRFIEIPIINANSVDPDQVYIGCKSPLYGMLSINGLPHHQSQLQQTTF